jgi:hypothetical protein
MSSMTRDLVGSYLFTCDSAADHLANLVAHAVVAFDGGRFQEAQEWLEKARGLGSRVDSSVTHVMRALAALQPSNPPEVRET